MAVRDQRTLRTVSVRLNQEDAQALNNLVAALRDADPRSELGRQMRGLQGRTTYYNAPVSPSVAIRWALRRAVETYPEDLGFFQHPPAGNV